MEATKNYFIKRANKYGILLVRERNPREDFTGWGALEFILNNGEVFVISGCEFGQGEGEDRLWVDMNVLTEDYFTTLTAKVRPRKYSEINAEKSAEDYLRHLVHG